MSPQTLIHLAAATLDVLELAVKSAQHARDWLQINQVAGDLMSGLASIAMNELLIPTVRESADLYRSRLRLLHRQSCMEYEARKPAGAKPSEVLAGSEVAA